MIVLQTQFFCSCDGIPHLKIYIFERNYSSQLKLLNFHEKIYLGRKVSSPWCSLRRITVKIYAPNSTFVALNRAGFFKSDNRKINEERNNLTWNVPTQSPVSPCRSIGFPSGKVIWMKILKSINITFGKFTISCPNLYSILSVNLSPAIRQRVFDTKNYFNYKAGIRSF